MKQITLHRSAVDNAGRFLDAGAQPFVGDEDDQINPEHAAELVDAECAIVIDDGSSDAPAKKSRKAPVEPPAPPSDTVTGESGTDEGATPPADGASV